MFFWLVVVLVMFVVIFVFVLFVPWRRPWRWTMRRGRWRKGAGMSRVNYYGWGYNDWRWGDYSWGHNYSRARPNHHRRLLRHYHNFRLYINRLAAA